MILKLTNTGDDSMILLKDPRGLLSTFPTNIFVFTDSEGQRVQPRFVGAKVKYAPDAPTPDNYASLRPGESVQVVHNLYKAYDFSALPLGTYTVAGNDTFYKFDNTSGTITPINPTSTSYHTFTLLNHDPNLPKINEPGSPPNSTLSPAGPSYIDCTEDQQIEIESASHVAQDYATGASLYANSITGGTSRYDTWFGVYAKTRHDLVVSQFASISSNNFSSFTYNCSCTESNVYAYVYPDNFGRIYLCGAFWQAPVNGTDSKGGTLVHEASHFTANAGGTEDYTYGQPSCKFLSLIDPDSAATNADSHEYFAENNPALA